MARYIFGNWKMAQALDVGLEFVRGFSIQGSEKVIPAIFPSFSDLAEIQAGMKSEGLKLGAQDCSAEPSGAFTGEISAARLKQLGCEYCLVGHSERRQRFPEDTQRFGQKLDRLAELGITAVFCFGES